MQATSASLWPPRLGAFGAALCLAGSVVYWLLCWQVADTRSVAPPLAQEDTLPGANPQLLARLLDDPTAPGSAEPAPGAIDASSRFRLVGVVNQGAQRGVALLSVDGKPAQPYRQGAVVAEGWVLQSVQRRSVALGAQASGAPGVQLQLPPAAP